MTAETYFKSASNAGCPAGCPDGAVTTTRAAETCSKSTTIPIPIHEVAEEHRLAANDSDEDHSKGEPDNDWWHEVECRMEDDFKADRDWWGEVDSVIRADEAGDSNGSIALVGDEPRFKRELCAGRCTGDAKRVKRPG